MQKFRFFSLILLADVLAACGGETAAPEPVVQATQPPAAEVVEIQPTPTLAAPATLPPPVISGGEEGTTETAPDVVEEPAVPMVLPPWPADQFGYGVQSHAIIGDPAFTVEVVKNQLGMDWVKVQLEWWLVAASETERQWFFYDGIVDEASKKGLYLMFSIVGAPEWTRAVGNHIGPPDDYNHFTHFLTELIARYPNQIHAIEVWNEMNLDREWQTAKGLNPEDYVEFLRISHGAIKAADPNIIVISGALSPTGDGDWVRWANDFDYLDRALAAGLVDYADCIGAHHNGYNLSPNVPYDQTGSAPKAGTATFRGPFDNPHPSWSFKTTLDVYAQKVQAFKPGMKLCVTEFGWASAEGYDTYPEGFGFALDNTLEDQATNLVLAFEEMYASGNVWIAYVFNYDFGNKGGGPTDDVVPYSIVDTNGVPRPAFHALAQMEKRR